MRDGDFSGANFVDPRSAHGPALPGQRDPGEPHRPRPRSGSWTSSTRCRTSRHALERHGRLPAVRARRRATATAPTSASTTRPRRTTRSSCARSYQHRDPQQHPVRGRATRSPTSGIRDTKLDTATVIAGWTKILSPTHGQRVPRRLQLRQDASAQSNFTVGRGERGARARDRARASGPDRSGFPSLNFAGGSAASRPTNITDGGRNADRTIKQNSFSISNNLSWIMGGHSLKAGGLCTRNSRRRRLRQGRRTSAASTASTRARTGQRVRGHAARAHPRRRRPRHARAATSTAIPTTSRSSSRTTGGSTTA